MSAVARIDAPNVSPAVRDTASCTVFTLYARTCGRCDPSSRVLDEAADVASRYSTCRGGARGRLRERERRWDGHHIALESTSHIPLLVWDGGVRLIANRNHRLRSWQQAGPGRAHGRHQVGRFRDGLRQSFQARPKPSRPFVPSWTNDATVRGVFPARDRHTRRTSALRLDEGPSPDQLVEEAFARQHSFYRYVDGDPVGGVDPLGLLRVYEIDGFEFHAFPGPPAGGPEHARHGEGKSYHIHVRAADGTEVRYSTETWKPLAERDASRETKGHRTIIKDLTEGERKLLDRVTREVFHRGHPNEQQIRGLGRARGVRQAGGRFCPPRGSRE